eukprot:Em0011g868a
METQPLFAVEFILEHPTPTKEHIVVLAGEMGMVLLMKHDKLSDGKYIVEKSDGTVGYVDKKLCKRMAYQGSSSSLQNSVLGTTLPSPKEDSEAIEEDIYEKLTVDEEKNPPPLPTSAPPPLRNGPPTSRPHAAFPMPPPPSCPAPPPPQDEPDETYEPLPGES